MPTHELFVNKNGTTSLREVKSGEVMHSSVGPREEATLLYIEQSELRQRLSSELAQPLVLWDVGLGAGTNALAALQCHREALAQGSARNLMLISFESDLSGMRLALEHKDAFPFFGGLETAAQTLLDKRVWQSADGQTTWQLHEGLFQENLKKCAAPELIFFDFYSPKTCPQLWDVAAFESIHQACEPRGRQSLSSTLYTYSASTRIRVALLLAGFFVGYGRGTGAKNDTTVASTCLADLKRPLDGRWLERLHRSHEPLPHGWPPERSAELFEKVLTHPQFKDFSR